MCSWTLRQTDGWVTRAHISLLTFLLSLRPYSTGVSLPLPLSSSLSLSLSLSLMQPDIRRRKGPIVQCTHAYIVFWKEKQTRRNTGSRHCPNAVGRSVDPQAGREKSYRAKATVVFTPQFILSNLLPICTFYATIIRSFRLSVILATSSEREEFNNTKLVARCRIWRKDRLRVLGERVERSERRILERVQPRRLFVKLTFS